MIADPFMGSGSTVAACEAIGVEGVGIERHREYFDMARTAIPQLKTWKPTLMNWWAQASDYSDR